MDGECNDSARSKTVDGRVDRLDANGKSESWVKVNLYNLSRKIGEHDNILHRPTQMNLIDSALCLAWGAGQEAHGEGKQTNHR